LFRTRIGGYTLTRVTSIGQDAVGEIYVTTLGGDVFKIKGGRGGAGYFYRLAWLDLTEWIPFSVEPLD